MAHVLVVVQQQGPLTRTDGILKQLIPDQVLKVSIPRPSWAVYVTSSTSSYL